MKERASKYKFYNNLKSILDKEKDFEKDFSFISFSEYSEEINHNDFVVYEDWWIAKPDIVFSKIKSKLGLSQRIFARKTELKRIDKLQADSFLNENHIYGTVKSKYKLGLFYNEELVAVATFSPQRNLAVGRSVELVRFCSKNGTTIIGGLDKLVKHYEREFQPDHIMTYIDKDWGSGEAFLQIGFSKVSERNPIKFCINTTTGERSIINSENINCDLTLTNRGSIKVEKYLFIKLNYVSSIYSI